jgi:hypothetical protein
VRACLIGGLCPRTLEFIAFVPGFAIYEVRMCRLVAGKEFHPDELGLFVQVRNPKRSSSANGRSNTPQCSYLELRQANPAGPLWHLPPPDVICEFTCETSGVARGQQRKFDHAN